MALVSPGVEVNVIDESFYTPAAAGTVPMIFVATAENKPGTSGIGVARGTLKVNAGKPYLITSQRELSETFGDALFYSDNNNNMIHAGELNEYGIQTAYSLLGVSNRAYVVRADLDLGKLQASSTAPGGEPAGGAYWFDTQVSRFGLLAWNSAPVTTTGGQSFSTVPRTVIIETNDIDANTDAPKRSIGQIGEYAVDATTTANRVWFKTAGVVGSPVTSGDWVIVGSSEWKASHPVVRGTNPNPVLVPGDDFTINGTLITISGNSVEDVASDINVQFAANGIYSAVVNGALEIYSDSADVVIGGPGTLVGFEGSTSDDGALGITEGTYSAPRLAIQPHTNVPTFKRTDVSPAPTGSLWLKTTTPNGGAEFSLKQYNGDTQLWETLRAPLFTSPEAALFSLDKAGGGRNLRVGDIYIKANIEEQTPQVANYKFYRRVTQGPTQVESSKISEQLIAGTSYEFDVSESRVGEILLSSPRTINFEAVGAAQDAEIIAAAINSAGFTNIVALVDASNRLLIQHNTGGEVRLADTTNALNLIGFAAFDLNTSVGTVNLYAAPKGDVDNDFVASSWKELEYTADPDEPLSLTADGELWYSSVVDEVDIMIHDGENWVGYQNYSADYEETNATGPIVSATEPDRQRDDTALVDGDLWIDTADIDNYPGVHRYNDTLQEWELLDKSDQTSENGILFADARWSDAGSNSAAADIDELLVSDYLDPDAPDPALYPKGMLLWNLRRSGFNVKRFVRNYIDLAGDNQRFQEIGNSGNLEDQPMATYYANRWVTDSSNNIDGSGSFGRIAQRKSVVQALQAMVNSNQAIRDDETRQFNLIATPGYPELIGEMITLNYDRRLSAFVVGDTPARLTPDATTLNEWGSNVNLAVEDNINGAVSRDEYLGMYYPWGFTSDNNGNNIVVPPSHMALRTLILNDQVAFPWFAPAGTRRGGVTNASASGYVSSEGEFISIALNTGQRDTLYSNSINPITFINGAGLVVFGQKTRARNASALDRINVARLIVYLRGQLELLARPYLFEPNDKITRDQIKAAADSLLLELVGLRALYDFLAVCDESNNTPARIDRNELYLDIAIEPVKAIEFIYIPLRIKNTGEIASLG